MKKSYIRYIRTLLIVFAIVGGCFMPSCVDDNLGIKDPTGSLKPWEDKSLACVPLGISYQASSTRATDTVFGSASEHEIDFTTAHECYAIFFTTTNNIKTVKYIKPLYYNQQLTDSYTPSSTDLGEYTVFAVAYVPKDDVQLTRLDYDSDEEFAKAETKPKISDVLVVLNGGKVYKKFHDLIYGDDDSDEVISDITPEQVREITWDYPMIVGEHFEKISNDGPIGINSKGLFTMTNSAYLSPEGKLMTVRELEKPFYSSVEDYLKASSPTPNAQIQVERMVAKFSEPSLATEVFGSERFFRPSDNVPHLVVYDWDGEDSHSQEIDWRIHLLGWTINGGETQSYLFKKIKSVNTDYLDWSFSLWNNPTQKRSYWSEDPHYDNEESHFYPWQFRLAADLNKTVSWQAGTNQKMTPVLRYSTFNEINWNPVLYFGENTFKPNPERNWDLDSRTELLAGSHLILTAEIYLKGQESNGSYLPDFGTVSHLYSDRIQRYYLKEIDFFKMFVSEFQNTVSTQWSMKFNLLDWDNPTNKIDSKYQASPEGDYKLYYRCPENEFNSLAQSNIDLYDKINQEAPPYKDKESEPGDEDNVTYVFREMTFSIIDAIYEVNQRLEFGLFSHNAQIYQGDGRVIPWHDRFHVRKLNPLWKSEVETPDIPALIPLNFINIEGETPEQITGRSPNFDFRKNIYRSFIREWWGPVDHYNGGRMYYSGSIAHQNGKSDYLTKYYGTVRNHWYKFTITSINGIGTPVDDPNQLIIPDKYAYKDQMGVHTELVGWHLKDTQIDFGN